MHLQQAFAWPRERTASAKAAAPGNVCARAQDYFWLQYQFGEPCSIDRDAFRVWHNTPRISADGPHAIRRVGMYENCGSAKDQIDWAIPVFKLTHRLERDRLSPDCLVGRLLGLTGEAESVGPSHRTPCRNGS
jgi:hypothetical protein